MGGYYTAVTGATITAANWNTYVRDQGINQFATATARDAAITSPTEGMVVYLADSDTLWFYSGSTWKPVSYHKIASTTLGSAAASITFSSIPQTYNHLQLIINGKSSSATNFDSVLLRFNGDSTAGYSRYDQGASNTAGGGSANVPYTETNAQTSINIGDIYGQTIVDTRVGGHIVCDIPFFTDTTFAKHTLSRQRALIGTGAWIATDRGGGWFSANAINQIGLTLSSAANFVTGTRADLIGIA